MQDLKIISEYSTSSATATKDNNFKPLDTIYVITRSTNLEKRRHFKKVLKKSWEIIMVSKTNRFTGV